MKLLRASFTAATTLKTFRRHTVRNVMIAAAAGNSDSETAMIAAEKEAFGLSKGVEPSLVSFNAVLQGLCRERRITEAEEVRKEMNRKGLDLDERTYTSMIHLFCNSCNKHKAYRVLNEMIDSGFSPSVDTYNDLVNAYCTTDGVEEAVGILSGMAERGLSPVVDSYNSVISCFCKLEEPELERAIGMKVEMVQKGILPDAVTYSLLIHALCPQGRLAEAFDLFREMLRGGGGVSPVEKVQVMYSTLMEAYCLEGEFSKAFHLRDEIMSFLPDFATGFSPALVTYNALIHGLCFMDRAEEALGILRGMAEMGLSPDSISYSTVISGFCRIREPGKAFKLKVEMNEVGMWLDQEEDTYRSLMEGLSDEVTYASLMNDYLAQDNMEKAYTLDYEMDHNGYLPSSVTSSVFLNGLHKKARTVEAKQDLLLMISNTFLRWPTHYIAYDILIENCSNNEFKSVVELVKGFRMRGLENEAAGARDTMLEGNYKPDGAIYNLLIFDHCKCLNGHEAYDLYMEMVHYGFAPHMFSVIALIDALDKRYNELSWVIQSTLRSCNLNDSELLKELNKIDVRKCDIRHLRYLLAERAMDGLLLDGRKYSYASAST